MLRSAIRWLHPCCPRCTGSESTLILVDLEDVFNTGYAAAEATRRAARAAADEIAARHLDQMVAEAPAARAARAAEQQPQLVMPLGLFASPTTCLGRLGLRVGTDLVGAPRIVVDVGLRLQSLNPLIMKVLMIDNTTTSSEA